MDAIKQPTAIIAPIYNESASIELFLDQLFKAIAQEKKQVELILVDDGSTDNCATLAQNWLENSEYSGKVIRLARNAGHQSAIAAGIKYAYRQGYGGAVIMDADGEDDPSTIPLLLKESADIVLVTRGKRNEGPIFRIAYWFFKLLFRMVIGKKIDHGNFSFISRKVMAVIADQPFIHYAAALSRLNFSKVKIRADRKPRLAGKSKMGFSGLVIHGIRALTEFPEELLMSFLRLTILFFFIMLGLIVHVLIRKLFTDLAIPGWASTMLVSSFTATLLSAGFFILSVILLRLSKLQQDQEPLIREETQQ